MDMQQVLSRARNTIAHKAQKPVEEVQDDTLVKGTLLFEASTKLPSIHELFGTLAEQAGVTIPENQLPTEEQFDFLEVKDILDLLEKAVRAATEAETV